MTSRSILIFFLLLSTYFHAKAQSNFQNGYILTLENDTIRGWVNSRNEYKNYNSCHFKKDGETTSYYPHQIKGFGFDQGKYYSSGIIKEQFAETLVAGELSLYKHKSQYVLKKGAEIFELQPKEIEVGHGGEKSVYEDKKWRRVVAYLISDCLTQPNEIVGRIVLQEKSLTRLVSRYNQCNGGNYLVYKESKPWTKLNVGATVGIHHSTLGIYEEFEDLFFYLDGPYHSIDPSFGVIFTLSAPRLSERISFQTELHYFKTHYSSQLIIERSITEIHKTNINLTTLSFPISFKYTVPYEKFALNFQGGLNMDYHLDRKTKWDVQRIMGDEVTTDKRENPFIMDKNQNGLWAGVGIQKPLKKFNLGLSLRYFSLPGYNAHFFSLSRVGLNLIISR